MYKTIKINVGKGNKNSKGDMKFDMLETGTGTLHIGLHYSRSLFREDFLHRLGFLKF